MCGNKLQLPQPGAANPGVPPKITPATKETGARPPVVQPAVSPAGDTTKRRDLSYLLEEDEPSSTSWSRYLVMIALIAFVAGMAWHWRSNLQGLITRSPHVESTNTEAAPEAAPESAGKTEKHEAKSKKGEAQAIAPPATPAPAPDGGQSPQAGQSQAPAPANTPPTTQPADVPSTQGQASDNSGAAEGAPKQGEPAAESPAPAPRKAPRSKPSTQARNDVPTPAAGDTLETAGEKYLYGNGVRQDCGRAQRYLLKAARQSNTKAQSVLGTMYATGHCVSPDLPTAYHWFARALHNDPSNNRIEDDLKVLWNQMSADQRQTALHADN